MKAPEITAEQLYDTLRTLPEEQLRQVLRFVEQLESAKRLTQPTKNEVMAPLYQIHASAVRTGISDLAQQHDHYLYGLDKRDA